MSDDFHYRSVWTIPRCHLQGVVAGSRVYHQRKHSVPLVIHGLISHVYLPIFRNGKRLNPRTSTLSKCQFRYSALLSQSGIIFIFILDFATSESSSKSLFRTEIHARSTNFFLVICKILSCIRLMHFTTKFAMLFLSKYMCVKGSVYKRVCA